MNSIADLCSAIHERQVFSLRDRDRFYAHAAFFKLRAHAARKPSASPQIDCFIVKANAVVQAVCSNLKVMNLHNAEKVAIL